MATAKGLAAIAHRSGGSQSFCGKLSIKEKLVVACVFAAACINYVADAQEDDAPGTTSAPCRASLDTMLRDPNWLFMNTTFTRWCRVVLENEMSRCCGVADFHKGRAEGCANCLANCIHPPSEKLCEAHFGKACRVTRKPFFRTGAPGLEVTESFCVPADCTNAADKNAIMPWYSANYKPRRNEGWQEDYDEVTPPQCDDGAVTFLLWVAFVLVTLCCMFPLYKFLCVAEKQRGRVLVDQSVNQNSMQQDAAEGENVEPIEDLRATGASGNDKLAVGGS